MNGPLDPPHDELRQSIEEEATEKPLEDLLNDLRAWGLDENLLQSHVSLIEELWIERRYDQITDLEPGQDN